MRIIVGNLPDDVTEDGIREALSAFADVDAIKLVKESGTTVVQVGEGAEQAEALAKRIHGRMYKGRDLRAWVPLMDW